MISPRPCQLSRRSVAAILIFGLLLVACRPKAQPSQANATPVFVQPGELNQTVLYWDMGLKAQYPANWVTPTFTAGQLLLASSAEAASSPTPTQPIVAFRLVDTASLAKNTTLEDIALMLAGSTAKVDIKGTTTVAGVDAKYLGVIESQNQYYGLITVFRMPDGRVGAMIAFAPQAIWADFAPTADQIRGTIALIKPANFVPLGVVTEAGSFPQAGISFNYPKGWIDRALGTTGRLYRDKDAVDYADDSGFVNGPQLAVRVTSLAKGASLKDSLIAMIGSPASEQGANVTVGGQTGFQIAFTEPASGQSVTFIAVASQDKTALIVFRWTTPGLLADAVRPAFNAILQTVHYGPISGLLASAPPPATANP